MKYKFDIRIETKVKVLPCVVPENIREEMKWERIENDLNFRMFEKKAEIEKEFQEIANQRLAEIMGPASFCCLSPCCMMPPFEHGWCHCPICGKKLKNHKEVK